MTVLRRHRSNYEERQRRSELPDDELVRECIEAPEGDTRAFRELVERYEARVRANCRHLTRAPDDSWDLSQEVLVKAFYALPRFEERSTFRTWLWRIKANHCLNYLERRRVRSREEIVPVTDRRIRDQRAVGPLPDRSAEMTETAERVRRTLDELSDTYRIPLVLRDLDGLSYPEIAEQLQIGVSAAKMRVARAREDFRSRYRAEHPEELAT